MEKLAPNSKLSLFGSIWLFGLFALIVSHEIFARYADRATLLIPDDNTALTLTYFLSCVLAALSAYVGFTETFASHSLKRRTAFGYGLIGFLTGIGIFSSATNILQNRIYFPDGKTRKFEAVLPIDRAYMMGGRVRTPPSFTIQPIIWSNIEITEADYDFMLSASDKKASNAATRSIPSQGRFCARVTVETFGEAIRVLHAGSDELPRGSVMNCEKLKASHPRFPVVTRDGDLENLVDPTSASHP